MIYEDSYCAIWHGPRRGGKSGSMAVECMINLLNGKKVFSDNPVNLAFDWSDGAGTEIIQYSTEPLNYEELIYCLDVPDLTNKYMKSVIAWDEIDKRVSSHSWQSVFNKICQRFMTYIGKLEMTFLMTAQFINLVDNQIRIQIDAEIQCTDLSYMYSNLERGAYIGQLAKDISGRYTGRMFKDTGREYPQTLILKDFWPIFDTKHFPATVLESLQKVEIRQDKRVLDLRGGGIQNIFGDNEEFKRQKDQNALIVFHLAEEVKESGTTFGRQELITMARRRGFREGDFRLMNMLSKEGVVAVEKGQYASVY